MRIRALNTPNYQRNQLLRYSSEMLIYFIFNEYHRDRIKLLDELCVENAMRIAGSPTAEMPTPTFMYHGELHSASWYVKRHTDNREIHPAVMAKIADYFEKTDFDMLERTNRVKNYVDNVLLHGQNITDIYQLIPGRFHKVIEDINSEVYSIGDPLSPDQLEQFKMKNRAGLVELQKLLLEELLLA